MIIVNYGITGITVSSAAEPMYEGPPVAVYNGIPEGVGRRYYTNGFNLPWPSMIDVRCWLATR